MDAPSRVRLDKRHARNDTTAAAPELSNRGPKNFRVSECRGGSQRPSAENRRALKRQVPRNRDHIAGTVFLAAALTAVRAKNASLTRDSALMMWRLNWYAPAGNPTGSIKCGASPVAIHSPDLPPGMISGDGMKAVAPMRSGTMLLLNKPAEVPDAKMTSKSRLSSFIVHRIVS